MPKNKVIYQQKRGSFRSRSGPFGGVGPTNFLFIRLGSHLFPTSLVGKIGTSCELVRSFWSKAECVEIKRHTYSARVYYSTLQLAITWVTPQTETKKRHFFEGCTVDPWSPTRNNLRRSAKCKKAFRPFKVCQTVIWCFLGMLEVREACDSWVIESWLRLLSVTERAN